MSRFDAMYPACGPDCNCGMLCKRASAIDEHFASRLAFMLECMLVDSNGHWNAAASLLDEYKAEWEKINPSPPTFMGEPMPPERRERLQNAIANRAETAQKPREYHADQYTGGNTADVRADVRATGEPSRDTMANHVETFGSPMSSTPNLAIATPDVAQASAAKTEGGA